MSNPARSGSPRKGASKTTPKKRRLGQKGKTGDASPTYWSEVNPEHVNHIIHLITQDGGAVMFTRSQDGGVLGVRVYHDDYEVETLWGRAGDEMYEILADLTTEFEG